MNDLSNKRFKLDYAFSIEQLYALLGWYSRDEEIYYLNDFWSYVLNLINAVHQLDPSEIPDLEAPANE